MPTINELKIIVLQKQKELNEARFNLNQALIDEQILQQQGENPAP